MSETRLAPSIEKRIEGLIEVSRRNLRGYSVTGKEAARTTITISREFGCEGFPVAERLQVLLTENSGVSWAVMDKALLEEVAKNNDLAEELFQHLGEKNRFLDDMLSTFSPHWRSDKDNYRLLCRQVTALATAGNVIIVGRGGAILTQHMEHTCHFRIIAPQEFKIRSIAKRLCMLPEEAEKLIRKKQKQRDAFIRDFLNRDVADPTLYHLIFNNAKNTVEQMADTMFHYITSR